MGFGSGFGMGRGYGYGRGFGGGRGGVSGFSCIKFLFFGFNVLFWLLGCALLGVGIWLQISKSAYSSLHPTFNFLSATAICIMLGVFILLIGFFGCCGAIMENKCLLVTYFILVVVIFILEIIATVMLFVYRAEVEAVVSEELRNGLKHKYPPTAHDDPDGLREIWAFVQSNYSCCGVDNYTDWYGTPGMDHLDKTPPECCLNTTACVTADSKQVHHKGCMEVIQGGLMKNLYIGGIIIIFIILFQVLGLVASMTLVCLKKDKYYYD